MQYCTLIIRDEVNIRLEGLSEEVRKALVKKFKYFIPSARYTPSFKLGRWDGTIQFFGIGGDGYLSHLPVILEILDQYGYAITSIEDRRVPININFPVVSEDFWGETYWPKGHQAEGLPIRIKQHQLDSIRLFTENPQCIQELATSAGKCIHPDTKINICNPDGVCSFIITIGGFFKYLENSHHIIIKDNEPYPIRDLGYGIRSLNGECVYINHIIRKTNLEGLELSFGDIKLKCAKKHILLQNGNNIYAEDLSIGDTIDHVSGNIVLTGVSTILDTTFYDVGLDYPHLYIDHSGIIHHNTIITATLAKLCEPYGRTVTIVPSKSLVEQTSEDFINCGLDTGLYYGDQKDLDKTHTICTWQGLSVLAKKPKTLKSTKKTNTKKPKKEVDPNEILTLSKFLKNVNAVIVDEAHGIVATELKTLLLEHMGHVPIRWALTGTIPPEEHYAQSLYSAIGPLVNRIKAKELQDKGILSTCYINIIQTRENRVFADYKDEYKYLVGYQPRVAYLASMIDNISTTGNTLVLVSRISTGEMLRDMLPGSVFISGKIKTKDRKEEYDAFQSENCKILIATTGVAAVGINIISMFNLVLYEPGKSFVRVIQSIGRGLRKGFDKDHVEIWDLTADTKYSKRQLTERKAFYKKAEYPFKVTKVDWQE